MSERCKEIKCIDTTCKTCWPKKEKSEFDALMNGTLESLPRIKEKSGFYPLDNKGVLLDDMPGITDHLAGVQ